MGASPGLSQLLGHSTVTVAMRYAHTNYETKARAAKLLAVVTEQ